MPSTFEMRFHQVALLCALVGATVGFAATLAVWALGRPFPTACFNGSLFAISAALPVYYRYRQLLAARLAPNQSALGLPATTQPAQAKRGKP